jgi:hypothetical protein
MVQLDPSNCFTPAQAARDLIPGRPSVQTVMRWILSGIQGPNGDRLKLASFKVAGRRYVTREGVAEFIAASNSDDETQRKPSATEIARRSAEAGRALEALGCWPKSLASLLCGFRLRGGLGGLFGCGCESEVSKPCRCWLASRCGGGVENSLFFLRYPNLKESPFRFTREGRSSGRRHSRSFLKICSVGIDSEIGSVNNTPVDATNQTSSWKAELMTLQQIEQKKLQQASRFETAATIRRLLDEARENISESEDADDVEAEILALVSDDE